MAVRHTFLAVCLVLVCTAWWTKSRIEKEIEKTPRATPVVSLETAQFYSRSARKFSLGFDNLLAGMTWVALLQGASHEPLEHDGVSWEYAMVHAINTLDPKFTRAFRFGASFVSIFRRDKVGAKDILQNWTVAEPLYWQSHYTLGFHLYHEMHDYAPAADALLKASKLPRAPSWLTALGVRLLSESGGLFAALESAVELYDTVSDPEGRARLRARARSLNYNLQKAAWTEGIREYRLKYRREPAALGEVRALGPGPIDFEALTRRWEVPSDLQPVIREKFEFRYDRQTQSVVGILPANEKDLEHTGIYRGES